MPVVEVSVAVMLLIEWPAGHDSNQGLGGSARVFIHDMLKVMQ